MIENITIDNGAGTNGVITDNLRSGPSDRSYAMTGGELWADTTYYVIKQGDFNTYFTMDQNVIEGSTKDEGIIVRITGNTLGAPQGTDYQRVQIRYSLD